MFRDGIRRYMAAHKFSNTTTADLWAALSEASGKPVAGFAQSWTTQPGFPVVELETNPTHQFTLTQQRFTVRDPNAAPLVWPVPVAIEDVASPGKTAVVLIPDAKPVDLPAEWNQSGALKLNAGDVGYYRSEYTPEHFDKLLALSGKLAAADRLNLLGDTWALMLAGRQPATRYLDLLQACKDDSTPAIVEQDINRLQDLRSLLLGTPGAAEFYGYARGFLAPQLQQLGWDAKPAELTTVTELRGELIAALADYGDAGVTAEATRRFAAFLQDPASLPGPLRASVLHAVGIQANEEVFNQLHSLAVAATRTEDKYRYYSALGSVADPALLQKALAITLTDEAPHGGPDAFPDPGGLSGRSSRCRLDIHESACRTDPGADRGGLAAPACLAVTRAPSRARLARTSSRRLRLPSHNWRTPWMWHATSRASASART